MNGKYSIGDCVLKNWRLEKGIGEGTYGKVFKAVREDEYGNIYVSAIKIITIPNSQSEIKSIMGEGLDKGSVTSYFAEQVKEIVNEVALMAKLKSSSNIVSYEDYEVVQHKGQIGWDIIIRMELLTPLLDYAEKYSLTRNDVVKLGMDICSALELCRKKQIVHRDIKPENIFVNEMGDFKLGDFGISITMEKTTGGLNKAGSPPYMAPEVYLEKPYNSSVDIYSLGIVMYRFLNNNRTPFLPPYPQKINHNDREMALKKRIKGTPIPVPCNADKALARIVLKACAYEPKGRYLSPEEMRYALEDLDDEGTISVWKENYRCPKCGSKVTQKNALCSRCKAKMEWRKKLPTILLYVALGIFSISIIALVISLYNATRSGDEIKPPKFLVTETMPSPSESKANEVSSPIPTLNIDEKNLLDSYNEAMTLYKQNSFCEARDKFALLGDYRDSAQMAKECIFHKAELLLALADKYSMDGLYCKLSTNTDEKSIFYIPQSVYIKLGSGVSTDIRNICAVDGVEINYEDPPASGVLPFREAVSTLFASLGDYKKTEQFTKPTPTVVPTSRPTPRPTIAPTPKQVPGDSDLETIDAQIRYPKPENYLPYYRYGVVNAPNGVGVYGFRYPEKMDEENNPPAFNIRHGLSVTVISGEEHGFVCAIDPNSRIAFWINANYIN